jgi:acyl carrier protein
MISAERVIQLIEEEQILEEAEQLSQDTDLFAHGLDSMAMMQLLLQIEAHFDIQVPPQDMTKENFGNANQIATYLNQRQS